MSSTVQNIAFYLTPLKKLKDDIWYTNPPVGHNPLSQTVKRLCQAAGISGFQNQSFFGATRLFKSGVDEQLMKSRTGHRSIDGVHVYKHVSDNQRQELSDILNSATNGNAESKKKMHCHSL